MKMTASLIKALTATLISSIAPSLFAADTTEKPSTSQMQSQMHYTAESQPPFPVKGQYFTGEVQVDLLFPETPEAHYSGAYVHFQPSARSAWHYHPAGQHIVVISGTALTGTRDGNIISVKPGETIWCPPNLDHWHGASREGAMTHLVITGSKDGQNVVWKEKVSDDIYNASKY